MSRLRLLAAAIPVCLAVFPAAAHAGPRGVLKGEVLNTTCYGPCIADQQYPPYTGGGLRVAISEPRSGNLVRVLHPADGRFRLRLPAARYLVSASVNEQAPAPYAAPYGCWQADTESARVRASRVTTIELSVGNSCIV
jgi:hypothetical protein